MSAVEKHVPKHRAPAAHRAPRKASRAALKTSLTVSAMAVVGTGLAVSGGALAGLGTPGAGADLSAAASDATTKVEAAQVDTSVLAAPRDALTTRSDRRDDTDPLKADLLATAGGTTKHHALTRTEDLSDSDPRTIARALLAEFGFGEDQFGCLDSLWTKESQWRVDADNPYSSAYGIPQALPGSKMSSAGPDWATNPVTQIRWGLGYIQDRYGSPCAAWGHSQAHNFY